MILEDKIKCPSCNLFVSKIDLIKRDYICPGCGEVISVDPKKQLLTSREVKEQVNNINCYINKSNVKLAFVLGNVCCFNKKQIVDKYIDSKNGLDDKEKDGWIKLAFTNYASIIMDDIKNHKYDFPNSKLFFDKLIESKFTSKEWNEDIMMDVLDVFSFYAPGRRQMELFGTDASRSFEELFNEVGYTIKSKYPKTVYGRYNAYLKALESKNKGRAQRNTDREMYVDPLINDNAESQQRDLTSTSNDVKKWVNIGKEQKEKDAVALRNIEQDLNDYKKIDIEISSLEKKLANTLKLSKDCKNLYLGDDLDDNKFDKLLKEFSKVEAQISKITNSNDEQTSKINKMYDDIKANVDYIRKDINDSSNSLHNKLDNVSSDTKTALGKLDKIQDTIDDILLKEEELLNKVSSEVLSQLSALKIPAKDHNFDDIRDYIKELKTSQDNNQLELLTALNDSTSKLLENNNGLTDNQNDLASKINDIVSNNLRNYSICLDYSKASLQEIFDSQIKQKDYIGIRLRIRNIIENFFRAKTGYEIGQDLLFTLETVPEKYQKTNPKYGSKYIDNFSKVDFLNDKFNLGFDELIRNNIASIYTYGQPYIHGSKNECIDESALDISKDISNDVSFVMLYLTNDSNLNNEELKLSKMEKVYQDVIDITNNLTNKNKLNKTLKNIQKRLAEISQEKTNA